MDSTQNKTPSIKQQEQFIEFLKQSDPEVIDYAEDLLHGIYPQRTITEELYLILLPLRLILQGVMVYQPNRNIVIGLLKC